MRRLITWIAVLTTIMLLAWGATATANPTPHHGYGGGAPPLAGVFGKVTSVGGNDSPTACGTAGANPGTFVLTAFRSSTVWAVTVNASTTFVDPATTPPATFADVCVGSFVGALGTVSTSTDSVNPATKVFVAPVTTPPIPHGIFGTVGSVGGSDSPTACGTAGANPGTFSVDTWQNTTPWAVTVNASTSFVDQAVPPPASFANVCVGDIVGVTGTVNTSDHTVDPATKVYVAAPHFHHHPGATHRG